MDYKTELGTTFHIERAGNFNKVCENMVSWVKINDIKKEQVISISTNESVVVDGDAMLILFYRRDQDSTMASLNDLEYIILRDTDDWADQHQVILKKCAYKMEVLSLNHTPRNIGQMNVQILWYLPSSASFHYRIKHFEKRGSWQNVCEEATNYLNAYIAPHNMVSISIFEDDHPDQKNQHHIVIMHKQDDSAPLNKPVDIQGPIYELTFAQNPKDSWEEMSQTVCHVIEDKGFDQGRFLASTTNYTDGDSQAFALLKWTKSVEDALSDASRGGCSCTIF